MSRRSRSVVLHRAVTTSRPSVRRNGLVALGPSCIGLFDNGGKQPYQLNGYSLSAHQLHGVAVKLKWNCHEVNSLVTNATASAPAIVIVPDDMHVKETRSSLSVVSRGSPVLFLPFCTFLSCLTYSTLLHVFNEMSIPSKMHVKTALSLSEVVLPQRVFYHNLFLPYNSIGTDMRAAGFHMSRKQYSDSLAGRLLVGQHCITMGDFLLLQPRGVMQTMHRILEASITRLRQEHDLKRSGALSSTSHRGSTKKKTEKAAPIRRRQVRGRGRSVITGRAEGEGEGNAESTDSEPATEPSKHQPVLIESPAEASENEAGDSDYESSEDEAGQDPLPRTIWTMMAGRSPQS